MGFWQIQRLGPCCTLVSQALPFLELERSCMEIRLPRDALSRQCMNRLIRIRSPSLTLECGQDHLHLHDQIAQIKILANAHEVLIQEGRTDSTPPGAGENGVPLKVLFGF